MSGAVMAAMSGMGNGSGIGLRSPLVVSSFHHALATQVLLVLVAAACAPLVWSVARPTALRVFGFGFGSGSGSGTASATVPGPEPAGRRALRIGFGLLWLVDGLLQLQASMPLGLPDQVNVPAASGSPQWLQQAVGWSAALWNDHPVEAAAAAAWIQLALGAWLLLAPRGRASRLGGLATVGWAAVVWVFGEGMGGILAPGLSWAFGAPGAVLFYAVAGGLVALPEASWRSRRTGRGILAGLGAFYLGMAVLQAWPGRGFWTGPGGGIQQMVTTMSRTPQPHVLAALLGAFGRFDAGHGFAVNLFLVAALAAVGTAFLSGRKALVRPAVAAVVLLCVADWVLVQDLGFLGGLGTDPNSAIPQLLLVAGGFLALVRPATSPQPTLEPALEPAPQPTLEPALEPAPQLAPQPVAGRAVSPRQVPRLLAAGAVAGMLALGVLPMVAAAANPNPDPVLASTIDGSPSPIDGPAPGFSLVDQDGRRVSLAQLHGKVVLLTFLDPVCTSQCPIIAQQLRQTSALLGGGARSVELVAVDSNPVFTSVAAVHAFTDQEGLGRLGNWEFLTGPVAALRRIWTAYGIEVTVTPAGAMVDHSELVFVLGPHGRMRWALGEDPTDPFAGTGGASSPSAENGSFSVMLADDVRTALQGR